MEEDNAHDIFKWFNTLGPPEQRISINFREETYNAEITLRGNLLTCISTIDAKVPLLFVIEGATVRKYETEDSSFACLVVFPDPGDNLILRFDSEKARESWMVKIATCSHQMVRAQLDETAYKFYTMGVKQDADVEDQSTANSFYLTNPHKVTHNFAISQQNNLPARRVSFAEIMSESKLSIVLPLELVKLYKKWITEFACLLESRQLRWPSFAISGLHDVLREVRENSETLEQCSEFLQNYSGPPFRKSTEKHRVAFAPVPTNLHVHHSTVDQRVARGVLSCGTASALPLRFQSGGLTRLSTLLEIDQTYHDFNFFSKRQMVVDLKKFLGQLSHRIDVEWVGGSFDKRSKLCSDVADGVKSVYEQLKDVIDSVAELEKYVDILMDDEKRRSFLGQNIERQIPDSLQNQLDTIDAMLVSLSTKVAVMDRINDEQSKSEVYEKSVQDAICVCLDALLMLADSFMEAQLFGLGAICLVLPSTLSNVSSSDLIRSEINHL
ncbi:hypothetical protein ANCCAN_07941 [Ancylostoma caninum]|uniref:PH domain-containing protein n=1 Tax=Ancylostoma caninum TaxID=29170 RepID=A0A368GSV9_ANCCA|nr:hypothetical protein ANCCAN_07941 [Ancylostoma caninum]